MASDRLGRGGFSRDFVAWQYPSIVDVIKLIAGVVFAILGSLWLRLASRRAPLAPFPPWQRWSTYGWGAVALGLLWFAWGIWAVTSALLTH